MSACRHANLSPGQLGRLIEAGINDWGGVSPVTPDYVNPSLFGLSALRAATAEQNKHLLARLTVYPQYLAPQWLDRDVRRRVLEWADAEGLVRDDAWRAGVSEQPLACACCTENGSGGNRALDVCLRVRRSTTACWPCSVRAGRTLRRSARRQTSCARRRWAMWSVM